MGDRGVFPMSLLPFSLHHSALDGGEHPRVESKFLEDLPIEIIFRFYSFLCLRDLFNVARTCRWLNASLYSNFAAISARCLSVHGYRLVRLPPLAPQPGPITMLVPSSVALTLTRDEVTYIRESEHCLRYIEDTCRRIGNVNDPTKCFTVTDGVLVHACQSALNIVDGITYLDIHYAPDARRSPFYAQMYRWSFPVRADKVIALAVEPIHNVIGVLYRQGHRPNVTFFYEFKDMDLGGIHAYSILPTPVLVGFPTDIDPEQLTSRLLMSGQQALVLVANTDDFVGTYLSLVDWTEWDADEVQQIIITIRDERISDVAWVRRGEFMVATLEGHCYLMKASTSGPLQAFVVARFFLPDISGHTEVNGHHIVVSSGAARVHEGLSGIDTFYETLRARQHNILAPTVRSDSRDSLLVSSIATSVDGQVQPGHIYSIVVPLRDVLALVNSPAFLRPTTLDQVRGVGTWIFSCIEPHRLMTSDRWFFRVPVSVHRNLNYCDYTLAVVGTRTVELQNTEHPLIREAVRRHRSLAQPIPSDCLILTDYNPRLVQPMDMTTPIDITGVSSAMVPTGTWRDIPEIRRLERTVTRRTGLMVDNELHPVFMEDIVCTLPHRQVATYPLSPLTFCVLDERRIWLYTWVTGTANADWDVRLLV
ncbi:unnamed protein product [Peniophora sp. CBMAI 1063]|nr:unnamed protein product [Peniophora sp. CBMAI 1063]